MWTTGFGRYTNSRRWPYDRAMTDSFEPQCKASGVTTTSCAEEARYYAYRIPARRASRPPRRWLVAASVLDPVGDHRG